MSEQSGDIRARIDGIDRKIIDLLAQRMDAVGEIVERKRTGDDHPLRDDTRERGVFDSWKRMAEERKLSGYHVGRILREVLNYSRRVQEDVLDRREDETAHKSIRIGYQGVANSYSDLTITKLFTLRHDQPVQRRGYHTFAAVVEALEAEEIDYALLPIENTIAGSLNEVYQLLAGRALSIVGEEVWQVEHCLAGTPDSSLDGIRVIRSHPVALQQCQRFLDDMGNCKTETHFDTAAAADAVVAEGRSELAAICSEESARNLGLKILRRNVADEDANFTRFVLIARHAETVEPELPCKTSLIFTVNHRRGALAECLQAFSRRDINLTKLESRPRPESPWEYLFYVDIQGHASSPPVRDALEEVRGFTNHFKILGSYPRCLTPGDESETAPSNTTPVEASVSPPPAVTIEPSAHTERVPERSVIRIGSVEVGGPRFILILGPCAVESRGQMMKTAAMVKEAGADILRGGAFKPRTSPDSFQGLGFPGIDLLKEASRAYELPIVTEVMRPEDVDRVAAQVDALQVGARNMQNFSLLKKLGTTNRPVVLKRGLSATIEELLGAAEYITSGGNQRVILCERGIRTFETSTRNTLDVSAIPVLRRSSPLPIIVDPSHAAGDRSLVIPLALAAAAAGADGLMIEVHHAPAEALCDGAQALTEEDLRQLMSSLGSVLAALGRAR